MFTLQEIQRIPELLKKAEEVSFGFDRRREYLFVGCGSSYNLSLTASQIMEKHGYHCRVATGGKILVTDVAHKGGVAVLISRTGESTETVLASEKLRSQGWRTIGITCQPNSSLTKSCDESLVFEFANEKSVVMTGSFSAILYILLRGIMDLKLSEFSEQVLYNSKEYFESFSLKEFNHFVFLGYNEFFALSKEGALKLQEMALDRVEAHEPLEYRHGPKSTLTKETLIVVQSFGTNLENKLAQDLKELGAFVVNIGKDLEILVPQLNGFESPLRLIPILVLGYKRAIIKGLNPDSPRNLTKSVII